MDSVVKGSALPLAVISELQIPVNDVMLSLLLLPRDIAVGVLHTHVSYGGWGSLWLLVRSELNVLSGYLSALECRSYLTRTVLPEQLLHPLPGVNDDGSVFRRLCRKYHVTVGAPPLVYLAADLSLPLNLVRVPVLFVTTDVGHVSSERVKQRNEVVWGSYFPQVTKCDTAWSWACGAQRVLHDPGVVGKNYCFMDGGSCRVSGTCLFSV